MQEDRSNRFSALREADEDEEIADTQIAGWEEEISLPSDDNSASENSISSTHPSQFKRPTKIHKSRTTDESSYQNKVSSLASAAVSIGFPSSHSTRLKTPHPPLGRGGGLLKGYKAQNTSGSLLSTTGMDSYIPVSRSKSPSNPLTTLKTLQPQTQLFNIKEVKRKSRSSNNQQSLRTTQTQCPMIRYSQPPTVQINLEIP
jgi:hypothetical protein